VGDLTRDDVERLLGTARTFETSLERHVKKLPTLKGHLVVNLFFESSTRTSASFELAAKRLSADTLTVKSTGSSVDKGESLKDTALTLGAYDPDVIVIRHPQIGAPQLVAEVTDARVVNAGDGKHQHPTQALLDLYTLREDLGGSRASTSPSSATSSTRAWPARCCRRSRWSGSGRRSSARRRCCRASCRRSDPDIEAIRDADVVYVLRMQNERMEAGANFVPSLREYTAAGASPPSGCGRAEGHAPGPMNRGVEIDPRVADSPDSLITSRSARARGADGRPLRRAHRRPRRGQALAAAEVA
jgi:Aspartate carbamoyltransferase, catalytic chain